MASTVYVNTVTHVEAEWANDTNTLVYGIFGAAQNVGAIRTVLGLKQLAYVDANGAVLTGGSLDGMPIGITNPQAGKFTTVLLTGAITLPNQVATKQYVDGLVTPISNGLGTISGQNFNAVSLTGGTINGISIGATTPGTGVFSTLKTAAIPSAGPDVINKTFFDAYVTSLPTLGNMSLQNSTTISILGGAINGTTIGSTLAAAGTFSSLTAPSLVGTKATAFLDGSASGFTSYGAFIRATNSSQPHIGVQLGHAISQFSVNSLAGNALLLVNSTGRVLINGIADDGASMLQTSGDVSAARYLLSGTITLPNQAASKLYVDTLVAPINTALSLLQGFNGGFGNMSLQNKTAVQITGGTLDNVLIGGSTPVAATFSQITLQNTIAGALSGGLIHFEPIANYGLSISASSNFYKDIRVSVPAGGKTDFTSGPNTNLSIIGSGRVLIGNGATDDALSALQVKGDLKVTGQLRLAGTALQGAGAALFGSNCPATTLTAPRTWIRVILPGEIIGWMPVFV